MASCTSCKKRTTSFCFKHKVAVCDDCTVQPLHAELVPCLPCDPYGNYFDWLTSGEYEWPQRCGVCNRSVGTGEGEEAKRAVVRLVCKCLYHRGCLYDELSNKKQVDAPLHDDRSLRCLNCNAPIFDPAVQGKSKLRESVLQFLHTVDAQEGAYGDGITNGQPTTNGHAHKLTQPAQPTQSAALQQGPATIKVESTPPAAPSTSSSSFASARPKSPSPSTGTSPSISTPAPTGAPSPNPSLSSASRASQSSQPSRQRSSAALLASSTSSSSVPSAAIDIDEKQALLDTDRQQSSTRRSGRRAGDGKGRRWRLDRLIAWLMIACFVGSVLLYAVVSSQWTDKARTPRMGG